MLRSPRKTTRRDDGFTLIEAAVTLAMLGIFVTSIIATTMGLQDTFLESQTVSNLHLRARHALDRVVLLAGQAVTGDAEFSTLQANTSADGFHCLRFRLISGIDTVTGAAIYDDNLKVFIYGDHDTVNPCSGLIVGRGLDLSTVFTTGRGSDGRLGTTDDAVNTLTNGIPVVELLVRPTFAPRSGDMFTVDVIGRLVTFTIRLNARGTDGNFLLPTDLVLTERVALRQ